MSRTTQSALLIKMLLQLPVMHEQTTAAQVSGFFLGPAPMAQTAAACHDPEVSGGGAYSDPGWPSNTVPLFVCRSLSNHILYQYPAKKHF